MTWRPRGMRLGAMRQRITVQSVTVAISDAGDKTETWADLYKNEPATFEQVSGGETLRGRQVEAGVNAIFTVHYRSGYAPEQRVSYGGTNYGIVFVRQIEGGRRYMELHCRGDG